MSDRVYAGDDKQYFPDFNRWLSPGDLVPEEAPDDPRFVSKSTRKPKQSEISEPRDSGATPADNEEQS
jgi:hypothetical protein